MFKTFKGGLHISDNKNTKDLPIENFPSPKQVAIPMKQHIGTPAQPLVTKGDRVKKGQLIGSTNSELSCPIHSSISGTVTDIEMRNSYTGHGKAAFVIIENNFKDELCESFSPYQGDIFSADSDAIIEFIKNAGICGQGGDSFPTYAKISSATGKVNEIIINCAECEPYITEKHRLMLESSNKIVKGALVLMHATGASHMTFAIENNKMDAVSMITKATDGLENVCVEVLKTKYPQDDERQLVYVIKGIQIPAGKHPTDVGCVVFNAETCISVYNAVFEGMPLIETVLTVDGDSIKRPCNLRIPVGTSISDIAEHCGGVKENLSKIVNGGPMMGTSQWSFDTVVTKNTSALLFLSDHTQDNNEGNCIHCGKCLEVCPMNLMPNYLAAFSKIKDLDSLKNFNIMSCVECGCCTYICPGNVPIVQYIRTSKNYIISDTKKKEAMS